MEDELKHALNSFFTKHYSAVYKPQTASHRNSGPELRSVEGTDYYYTIHRDSDTICLIPRAGETAFKNI
jgi:hypothetical protein